MLRMSREDALVVLENQLSYSGYLANSDYTLSDFLKDDTKTTYFLSGLFGRGFQLHKVFDDAGEMYLQYSQYPEYETAQSFAWVLNRNNDWKSYRIFS